MQPRIDYTKLSPGGYKAMLGLERYLNHSSLEHKLLLMITFGPTLATLSNACRDKKRSR